MQFTAERSYSLPDYRPAKQRTVLRVDQGIHTALVVSGIMIVTILLTLVAREAGAMASCLLLSLAVAYHGIKSTRLSIPLFLCYAALEGLFKYTSGFSAVVYVIKPILEFVLLLGLVHSSRSRGLPIRTPKLAWLIFLLASWATIEVLHPLGSGIIAGIGQLIVWYLAPMTLFWTGYNYVRTGKNVETVCYSLLGISVVVSLFAALQFHMGQDWTKAHLPGYNIINQGEWWVYKQGSKMVAATSWRPASTTAMGGEGGLWAMWGMTVGIGYVLSTRTTLAWKLGLLLTVAINVYGIIISGCRLYVFAAIIEALLLFVVLGRSPKEITRNLCILAVVSATIWVGFITAQSTTGGIIGNRYADTFADPLAKYDHDRGGVSGRSDILLSMLDQYPFGVGYQRGTDGGNARDRQTSDYYINRDDAFNSIAGDMGWPGLIIAVVLFFAVIFRGWFSFRTLRTLHMRVLGGIFYSMIIGYLVCFFGGPVLNGADTFWFLLTLTLAMPAVQRFDAAALAASKPGAHR